MKESTLDILKQKKLDQEVEPIAISFHVYFYFKKEYAVAHHYFYRFVEVFLLNDQSKAFLWIFGLIEEWIEGIDFIDIYAESPNKGWELFFMCSTQSPNNPEEIDHWIGYVFEKVQERKKSKEK